MQHQRIAPPGHVLPPAEITQQLRGARLLYQGEIIEPELLEATLKPSAVLHLARSKLFLKLGINSRGALFVMCGTRP